MQRKSVQALLAALMISVSVYLWFISGFTKADTWSLASVTIYSLSPKPSAISTATMQITNVGSGGIEPAIVAAIVGALIAGAFGMFGIYYGAKQQKKVLRFQKELNTQDELKRQEEQRKAVTLEAARREMLLSRDNAERVQTYRRALHADPRISRLQILDMSRPMEITDIYVSVRVHEEARLRYEIDPLLSLAEKQHDPNALLRAGKTYLELRAGTALDPEEAIRKYKRCVIVGDPGAGKTTLLKFLALNAADQKLKDLPNFPIHIELNAFAANSEYNDLLDFAAHVWDERYAFLKDDARDYMEKMLEAGKALLLLDALDETIIGEKPEVADASYQRAWDGIMLLAARYPQAPMVVTARKAGYHQRMSLTGFTELEVVDFRSEDIEQFVVKWFACYHDQQKESTATELNAKLHRNIRMQALAANPLLLSLIVLVYEAQLDLPDRRADLYKRCVDVLLTEWDVKRNIRRRREFKPEHKRQLLAELAWHFHREGRRYFPERELQVEIARFLPALGLPAGQYDDVLQEITNENGLLKEQARGWYGFLHLTLQEYFVAQYVNERNELAVLLKHTGDPWWEEVLLLYAGQTSDASPLLQELLGQTGKRVSTDDLFHTNLITAGRCLAAHPTIRQVPLREKVVTCLFELLETTPYWLTRTQVAETLAEIGSTDVNSRLLKLLSNEQVDSNLQSDIAYALGDLGDRTVVPELLKLLSNEQLDSTVLRAITHILGNLGDRAVVSELLKLLSNKQVDPDLRRDIAIALGELGDQTVMSELLELHSDKRLDRTVQDGITFALLKLGDRTVVPELLKLFSDEQVDFNLRSEIAYALVKSGDRTVVLELLKLLSDEQVDRNLRNNFAVALGNSGDRTVVPELLKLLSNEQLDRTVLRAISNTLGNSGDRTMVPELSKLFSNKQLDRTVLSSIGIALLKLGDQTVVPELFKLLSDEQLDRITLFDIILALGEFANDEATIYKLLELLPREDVGEFAYEALWNVSRQAGIRVFVLNKDATQKFELVRVSK